MAGVLNSILDDVSLREDPLDRARAATQYLALLQQAQRQVALARIRDVGEIRNTTALSLRAIARELGVTTNAIAQVNAERLGRPRRRPRPPAPAVE